MRKTILGNGIRLLTIPKKETSSVTVLLMFPVGSRQESPKLFGVSHFIEHMLFKGTAKRPKSLDISRELDAVGAEFNAFTSKDHTGYYIRIDAKHIDLAIDMLSDMVMNSLFVADEMEREKKVILEEINMYQDNPTIVFEESLFGPGTSLGHNIAGSHQSVSNLKRSEVLAYRQKYYRPSNLVVAIAGRMPGDITTRVNRAFASFGAKTRPTGYARVRQSASRPRVRIRYKATEQIHLALGYPGLALGDSSMPALLLLMTILGGNMSSRLFTRIREQLGLAYMVRAEAGAYQDTGSVAVQAGLDKSRIREAITEILKVLNDVREHGVTARTDHGQGSYHRQDRARARKQRIPSFVVWQAGSPARQDGEPGKPSGPSATGTISGCRSGGQALAPSGWAESGLDWAVPEDGRVADLPAPPAVRFASDLLYSMKE